MLLLQPLKLFLHEGQRLDWFVWIGFRFGFFLRLFELLHLLLLDLVDGLGGLLYFWAFFLDLLIKRWMLKVALSWVLRLTFARTLPALLLQFLWRGLNFGLRVVWTSDRPLWGRLGWRWLQLYSVSESFNLLVHLLLLIFHGLTAINGNKRLKVYISK